MLHYALDYLMGMVEVINYIYLTVQKQSGRAHADIHFAVQMLFAHISKL